MPATRDMQLHIPRPNVRIDVAYSSGVYRKTIANVHVIANLPPIAKITTTWYIPVQSALNGKIVNWFNHVLQDLRKSEFSSIITCAVYLQFAEVFQLVTARVITARGQNNNVESFWAYQLAADRPRQDTRQPRA